MKRQFRSRLADKLNKKSKWKKKIKYFTMYCLLCKRRTVHVGVKEEFKKQMLVEK